MSKYVTVEVHGVVTQIAKPTDIPGYTEGLLEVFLPDEKKLTDEQADEWIKKNNRRMKAICKFLNAQNL